MALYAMSGILYYSTINIPGALESYTETSPCPQGAYKVKPGNGETDKWTGKQMNVNKCRCTYWVKERAFKTDLRGREKKEKETWTRECIPVSFNHASCQYDFLVH